MHRILKPGGLAYISLNGDGWYEYLYEDRFRKDTEEEKRFFLIPLWNATHARMGGKSNFLRAKSLPKVKELLNKADCLPSSAGEFISAVAPADYLGSFSAIMEHYTNDIKLALDIFAKEYVRLLEGKQYEAGFAAGNTAFQGKGMKAFALVSNFINNARDNYSFAKTGLITLDVPLNNRSYMPFEFEILAKSIGFKRFAWSSDAGLCGEGGKEIAVKPIYDADYRGQIAVWECIVWK
jgi:hypothetical protein